MLIYRDSECPIAVSTEVAECRRGWRELAASRVPRHESSIDLLIRYGQLESTLADALAPRYDSPSELKGAMRRIALSIAHLFRAAWRAEVPDPSLVRPAEVEAAFRRLLLAPWPKRQKVRTPEGYAYYGLYPECYLAAAERFARQCVPGRSVCIGLRSIGTSLSAVVAAALEAAHCHVLADTVRPRGKALERRLYLASAQRQAWRRWGEGYFLIVDEGPGLSGSSFCGSAEALTALGIPESRIVFFPSWDPAPERLLSPSARFRWRRHRKWLVPFEEIWLSGRRLDPRPLREISAGRWRPLLYGRAADYPAVQPYHERRKFLIAGPSLQLLKFSGLGPYGRSRFDRAQRLAEAGLIPPPREVRHGFLLSDFVAGSPLRGGPAPAPLLETAARYLAFVQTAFAHDGPIPFDSNVKMIAVNLREALGVPDLEEALEPWRKLLGDAPAVDIDGRMLPHEWLVTPAGYLKADALDHHNDHFFPGPQEIAWDVAGFITEFALGGEAGRHFVDRTAVLAGDQALGRRLPFYRLAYLAFRIGYADLACRTLGNTADGRRFARLRTRYCWQLMPLLGPMRRRP